MKHCPHCNETIKDTAIKCSYCGEKLTIEVTLPVEKSEIKSKEDYEGLIWGISGTVSFLLACTLGSVVKDTDYRVIFALFFGVCSILFSIFGIIFTRYYIKNFGKSQLTFQALLLSCFPVSLITLVIILFLTSVVMMK